MTCSTASLELNYIPKESLSYLTHRYLPNRGYVPEEPSTYCTWYSVNTWTTVKKENLNEALYEYEMHFLTTLLHLIFPLPSNQSCLTLLKKTFIWPP